MLEIKNIIKKYKGDDKKILDNVSFNFRNNSLYSIIGESGKGKSSLLNILSLLDLDFKGEIYFNNKKINLNNKKEIKEYRLNNIGLVFQSFNLINDDSVYSNLSYLINVEDKEKIIDEYLIKFNIFYLKDKLVKNLSGGEKQRVAIIRSILKENKIILADEPTGSLDNENAINIFKILKELSKDHLVIIVTHNKELAFSYSDFILELESSKLNLIKSKTKFEIENNLESKKQSKIIKFNFKYMFYSFLTYFKNKKYRTSFFISILSFSFVLIGITLFLKDGLKIMINETFNELGNKNQIILKRKDDTYNISSYYSISEGDILSLKENYNNEIKKIGASFLEDSSSFFPDLDKVSIYLNDPLENKIYIDSLSSYNFYDFEYVNNFKGINNIYPQSLNKIDSEGVVISLTNEDMLSLCFKINIKATFKSLWDYIEKFDSYLILDTANYYWEYQNEELFEIRGIFLGSETKIYHTQPFFNEYVFIERLNFLAKDILEEKEFPWELNKVYYFETYDEVASSLINSLIRKKEYEDYIFDVDKLNSNRVYCYLGNKKTIPLTLINEIERKLNYNTYFFNTSGGYLNLNSLVSGFINPTFFSFSTQSLDKIEDLKNKISYEEYYFLNDYSEVAYGNYLRVSNSSVKFTSKMNEGIEGNYPKSYDEIAISKGLMNLLNIKNPIGKKLYISTIIDYSVDEKNNYNNEFKTVSFKVSGVSESNKCLIYNDNYFSLALFRDYFNISSFNLNIEGVTFLLNNEVSNELIDSLNKDLINYEFINPDEFINETIDESLSFSILFLSLFSIISLVLSLILLIIFTYINFLEKKKEVAIYLSIGVSDSEIRKKFMFNNSIILSISLLFSVIVTLFTSLILKILIYSIFKINIGIYFSFNFIFIIVIFIILFSILSNILLLKPFKKIDFKKELH